MSTSHLVALRSLAVEREKTEDMDDLDAYMVSIKSGGMNATGGGYS